MWKCFQPKIGLHLIFECLNSLGYNLYYNWSKSRVVHNNENWKNKKKITDSVLNIEMNFVFIIIIITALTHFHKNQHSQNLWTVRITKENLRMNIIYISSSISVILIKPRYKWFFFCFAFHPQFTDFFLF